MLAVAEVCVDQLHM